MRKWIILSSIALVIIGMVSIYVLEPEYAYMPPEENVLDKGNTAFSSLSQKNTPAFDLWGQTITQQEAKNMLKTAEGREKLTVQNGAIAIDDALLQLGRETFYKETFGNEVFLTDILGILDGALTLPNITKAILQLKGQGTTNLQVELAQDVTFGDQAYKKGEKVDTGLDVPKGAYTPLGMPIKFSKGKVQVGISCVACHATVDRESKMVIDGAPNTDLNAGLLLALGSNSAAYFTNTDVKSIEQYIKDKERTVTTSEGKKGALPDPEALEKAVDATLIKWPRGNFDSTIDLESNPSQIPDSFTLGDHPYGWSGFAAVGPFKGLSSLNNNVHAQNSDILAQSDQSKPLFNIDKEVYIATILQNAANQTFRFDPKSGQKPSDFFATVDPTPKAPGVNEMVKPPNFPKISLFTPNGTIVGSPGYNVGEQINAMSVYQNTLAPPKPKTKVDQKVLDLGRDVYQRAGCLSCHAGSAYTNNRIISVKKIGTEPSRAKAFKATEKLMDEALIYTPDTPIPLPEGASVLKVPTDHLDPEQVKLALAHGDSSGGYKVKGLVGLYWTAPYLHDGGVAVGKDSKTQLGMAGTLIKGIVPDPENSLRALIDKDLRQKVIQANKASKALQEVHVQGIGHEYWVDSSTGYSQAEQDALVQYLLSLE
jgi:hypothetical protein